MSEFPPPLPGDITPPIPPSVPGPLVRLQPNRAAMVFVLGLLGLLVCFICGIVAWVMGNRDLKEMQAGRMDPSGRGLTQAGWILGIVSTILGCIGACIGIGYLIFVMLFLGGAAAAASSGGGR